MSLAVIVVTLSHNAFITESKARWLAAWILCPVCPSIGGVGLVLGGALGLVLLAAGVMLSGTYRRFRSLVSCIGALALAAITLPIIRVYASEIGNASHRDGGYLPSNVGIWLQTALQVMVSPLGDWVNAFGQLPESLLWSFIV